MKSKPAILLVLPAALLVAGCAKNEAPAAQAIVGEWRSSVQFKAGAFAAVKDLEFMYVFNLGGTLTESSNYDAAPPVPPAYGIWRSLGPGEFEAKYEFYTTQIPTGLDSLVQNGGWLPSGRGVLVERITLSSDGTSFTSTISYEPFDLEGKSTSGGAEAEGRGVRLAF